MALTETEVISFLLEFERLAEREDFALVRELIDEHAFFRFNDGDYVGRAAIQGAFERTWRGDPTIHKARYFLSDIQVLTVDERTASVTYTYNWEGRQGEQRFAIRGRGTRVLARSGDSLRIVHEHLSRFPASS